MPGLALKLAPHEQVLINGVVVENGPRRTQIVIMTEDAAVLRLREALSPGDVIGPASRAYYSAQQALSEAHIRKAGTGTLPEDLAVLLASCHDEGARTSIENARNACHAGNYYRVMRCLKPLVEAESLAAEATV